ncbi:hypothetical protein H5410_002638 [Solanum commersonii]|uniref:Uncharacterized protein n=1 Tax=Solanum commersonii TaxID=4109 RepID=A0A9J6B2I2_SOLCO|nr:hypothetical protein H5410_002638 [Solanum commersonii]
MPLDVYNMVAPHGQIRVEQVRVEHDRVYEMINDAFEVQVYRTVRNFIEHTMTLDIFKNNGLVRCPCRYVSAYIF